MRRFTTALVLVFALTSALSATAGTASAEPNPAESAVARITGPGHCC